MAKRLFRRYANRFAALNLVVLFALVGVWIPVQIYPILASWPVLEAQILYGTPHYARQTPLLNRVTFRINGDDHAEFLLWMDPDNRKNFMEWFSPANPIEVWALRINARTWFVTDVQSAENGLEPYEMYRFQILLGGGGIALTLLSWSLFLFFLREYWVYFRHRRWLVPDPPGGAIPHK